MQCENLKCQKKIVTSSSCNKCQCKFCSNSCMIDHFFDQHQSSQEEINISKSVTLASLKKINRKASISSYVKQGDFLSKVKYESYFNYENFEKVKIGKKSHILGSGAFGDVYLVKHKVDGNFFAVKKMNKQRILDTGAKLDIVRREIDIHSRLIHDNIVRLYSFYEDPIDFFLILEYANSGTLFSAIKKQKQFSEEKAFKYFIQTCSALFFLHENNLIHRDLKPENLLIDLNDNIKLCDFGWCTKTEIGNRKTFCGTIEYMAPEIVKEMPYDCSIDVWSVGILLYELLHGYSPFRAQNVSEENETTEIFRNIIKNKFTIERRDLTENCKDLITSNFYLILELLSPDNSSRMKIKDIFSHPWVVSFEPNLELNPLDDVIKDKKSAPLEKAKSLIQKYDNKPQQDLTNLQPVLNNISPIVEDKNKPKNKSLKQNEMEENREKIKENLNSQKKISIQAALNFPGDFYLDQSDKSDSLFDKVLTQVKEKNKDKKKKSKPEGLLNLDVNKRNERDKKIVLRMEKEEKIPIKKKGDFQMFDEIAKIEKELDSHINEQNKKYTDLEGMKSDINKMLERDNINNISTNARSSINRSKSRSHSFMYEEETAQKKNSVNSANNLIANLQHKSIKEDENKTDLQITRKIKENISNKPPVDKKPFLSPAVNNYNDQLFSNVARRESHKVRNSSKGRDSNKNQKIVKDINKELDLSFLPKDLLYNNQTFQDSNKNLLSAIDLLEKASQNKNEVEKDKIEEKGFWEKVGNFLNPFKCG